MKSYPSDGLGRKRILRLNLAQKEAVERPSGKRSERSRPARDAQLLQPAAKSDAVQLGLEETQKEHRLFVGENSCFDIHQSRRSRLPWLTWFAQKRRCFEAPFPTPAEEGELFWGCLVGPAKKSDATQGKEVSRLKTPPLAPYKLFVHFPPRCRPQAIPNPFRFRQIRGTLLVIRNEESLPHGVLGGGEGCACWAYTRVNICKP